MFAVRLWVFLMEGSLYGKVSCHSVTPPTELLHVSLDICSLHKTASHARLYSSLFFCTHWEDSFTFSASITALTKVAPGPITLTPQIGTRTVIGSLQSWQGASPATGGGDLFRAVISSASIGRRCELRGDCALVGLAVSRVGRGLAGSEESNKRHTRESFSLSTRSVSPCAQRGDSVWSSEIGDLPLVGQLET